jgi:hypothetical protein
MNEKKPLKNGVNGGRNAKGNTKKGLEKMEK